MTELKTLKDMKFQEYESDDCGYSWNLGGVNY